MCVMRHLAALFVLALGPVTGFCQGPADLPPYTPAQELALYTFVLRHSAAYCRSAPAIEIDSMISDAALKKLKRIDRRVDRRKANDDRAESLYVERPELVANRRWLVYAEVFQQSGEGRHGFNLILTKSRSGWKVREAKRYPVPSEMLVAAIECVFQDVAPDPAYVDAPAAVVKALKKRHPNIKPIDGISRNSGRYWEVEVNTTHGIAWLDRQRARVYLGTMSHAAGSDVYGEYGGPILVWRSGSRWKAKVIDWGGE